MDLSSYYQSVFYQSRDSVSFPQHSVGSVWDNMYTQYSVSDEESCHQLNDKNQVFKKVPDSPPYASAFLPHPGRVPRIPPLAVLQQRRLAANARERKRANKINFAFNRLRKVLPGFEDREISKFEAIILAQDYIKQLVEILNNEEDKENTQVTESK